MSARAGCHPWCYTAGKADSGCDRKARFVAAGVKLDRQVSPTNTTHGLMGSDTKGQELRVPVSSSKTLVTVSWEELVNTLTQMQQLLKMFLHFIDVQNIKTQTFSTLNTVYAVFGLLKVVV